MTRKMGDKRLNAGVQEANAVAKEEKGGFSIFDSLVFLAIAALGVLALKFFFK